MTARFMSCKQVAEYLGKSRSTVYRWTERGLLPAPVRLAADTEPMWDREAIDRKLDRRPASAGRYTDPDESLQRLRERLGREAAAQTR